MQYIKIFGLALLLGVNSGCSELDHVDNYHAGGEPQARVTQIGGMSPTPSKTSSQQTWEPHFYEAHRLWGAGEKESAIKEMLKVIEAGHDDKEVYRQLAEWSSQVENFGDEELYLRKLLAKDQDDARAHFALTESLVKTGRYEEAIIEAKITKKMYKEEQLDYLLDKLIGEAYDKLGEWKNARDHYAIFLKRASFAPSSDDYKRVSKRIDELDEIIKNE